MKPKKPPTMPQPLDAEQAADQAEEQQTLDQEWQRLSRRATARKIVLPVLGALALSSGSFYAGRVTAPKKVVREMVEVSPPPDDDDHADLVGQPTTETPSAPRKTYSYATMAKRHARIAAKHERKSKKYASIAKKRYERTARKHEQLAKRQKVLADKYKRMARSQTRRHG